MIYTIRSNTAFTIVKQGIVYGAGQQIDLSEAEFEQNKHKLEGVEASVLPIVYKQSNNSNFIANGADITLLNNNANYQNLTQVDSKINALIDNAPGTLDTLSEIATALAAENDAVAALTAVNNTQNTAISGVIAVNNTQNTAITNLTTVNNNQDTAIAGVIAVNNTQNASITANAAAITITDHKINALKTYRGAAPYPGIPAINDRWQEISTAGEFVNSWFWNGTYWLSEQILTNSISDKDGSISFDYPLTIDFDGVNIFLLKFKATYRIGTTNDASNFWKFFLSRRDPTTSIQLASFQTDLANGISGFNTSTVPLNLHININSTNTTMFTFQSNKSGSASNIRFNHSVFYRLARI